MSNQDYLTTILTLKMIRWPMFMCALSGNPKGAMLTHGNIVSNCSAFIRVTEVRYRFNTWYPTLLCLFLFFATSSFPLLFLFSCYRLLFFSSSSSSALPHFLLQVLLSSSYHLFSFSTSSSLSSSSSFRTSLPPLPLSSFLSPPFILCLFLSCSSSFLALPALALVLYFLLSFSNSSFPF